MSYKIAKSIVGGRVIEECDLQDGINPEVKIAANNVYETGVTNYTGYATFVAGGDSCIIPFHKHNTGLVAGTKIGSSDFATAKDTDLKINVYIESGELKIQNKTSAEILISLRF